MTINTAAQCKLYIGSESAGTETLEDFALDTYVEIGQVEDMGQLGDSAEEVRFAGLGYGRYRKLPGVRDGGTLPAIVANDPSDAGQAALLTAFENNQIEFNFRVELHDALSVGGLNTNLYFRGRVLSKQLIIATVNNVVRRTFNIAVNSAVFEDPTTVVDPLPDGFLYLTLGGVYLTLDGDYLTLGA